MQNFQSKRKNGGLIHSKPVLIFLTLMLLFFAFGVFGFIQRMSMTRENREIAENKVAELQREKEKLSVDIQKFKTDRGVEENIRHKFGLAKEGEGVIVVVDDKNEKEEKDNDNGGFLSFLFFWNWFD